MKIEGCPFCGVDGDNVACYAITAGFTVLCISCKGAGPLRSTAEDAVEMWNKVSDMCKRIKVEVF